MQADADPTGRTRQLLHAALLDFHRSPGKYRVGLKQPPLLFASIRAILQIAIGRPEPGRQAGDQASENLRQAAGFFIRTAMLNPGSSHYALLGLDPAADPNAVKDRYRLMMRLLHPDFVASEPGVWPATAAVRVNLAYEVLASPLRRREYDAALATEPQPAVREEPTRASPPAVWRPAPKARSHPARVRLKRITAVFGLVGFGLLAAAFIRGNPGDVVHLVQHAAGPPVLTAAPPPVQALAAAPAPAPAPAPVEAPPASAAPVEFTSPIPPATVAPVPLLSLASPAPPVAPPDPVPRRPVEVAVQLPASPATAAPATVAATPAPAVGTPVAVTPAPPPSTTPVVAAAAEVPPLPQPVAPQVSRPPPMPAVTLSEAQPLLATLLQSIESGRSDRMLNLLDREARRSPASQALSRQLDGLLDGARPVRLSNVVFRAEPGEGRLLVTGHMQLHTGDAVAGSIGKKLALRVEFAARGGAVVMTGLSEIAGN